MSAIHDYTGANLADPADFPELQPKEPVEQPAAEKPGPEEAKPMTDEEALRWLLDVAPVIAALPLDGWLEGVRMMEKLNLNDQQRDGVRIMKGTIKAAQPLQRFVLEEQKRQRARKGRGNAGN